MSSSSSLNPSSVTSKRSVLTTLNVVYASVYALNNIRRAFHGFAGYIALLVKYMDEIHIDRIDPCKPYTVGKVRLLHKAFNMVRRHNARDDITRSGCTMSLVQPRISSRSCANGPFPCSDRVLDDDSG